MSMELKSSSLKPSGLSSLNCVSDPDEKEISDDDDDDRNHKHRRRETRSQSSERDPSEQALTQPYRKRNRTLENGQSDPQSHYNLGRDFMKFEKRRPPGVNFSRFPGEHGSGRGRGRDFQRDLRFGSVDVASQMAHPGPIQSGMFTGRGLPNVPNVQSAPWNGFGLLPPIPNGAIEAMNPLGMPGILRPQLNPSLNIGIHRQRCRDFEERGFCLRGDMCPMEHGLNRIVVEDVQSLSQFNLPVSISSSHVLGASGGSGFIPPVGVSSGTMMNSRGSQSRTSKSAVDDDSLAVASIASGADVYDPDQPLWNNDGNETSTPLLGLQPPHFDESEPFIDADLSDRLIRSSGAAIGSQSTSSSVWGRLKNSKNRLEVKEKTDSKSLLSEFPESKSKEIREASSGTQGTSLLGKQSNGGPFGTKVTGSTSKLQNDAGAYVRKPSQKAQRTLFVNCIPLKDNKKENLLFHFKKFGEVIDIYIPANSERAFVQFSKREEAERALKAPDAVMGSRFIKLWWANRDSVAEEGTNSGNNAIMHQGVPAASGSSHLAVVNRGNVQHAVKKVVVPKFSDSIVTVANDFKPFAANSPKGQPPAQKNMESLEHLKEELRKKQEMLEQKRSEFRRQLDKLAKQAPVVKGEASAEQVVKKQKVETSTDVVKVANSKSAKADVSGPILQAKLLADKMINREELVFQRSRPYPAGALQDPPNLKQTVRPMAISAMHSPMNRYKLDNRPTTFKINAPLPYGLANAVTLRDHFSLFGAVSNVDIEDAGDEEIPKDHNNSEAMKNCSARVSFATRHSAERAFLNGKSWNGFDLQFSWVSPIIPSSSRSSGESSSALKATRNAEVQSEDKTEHHNSQSISGLKECHSSPSKSSHELSGESSRYDDKEHSPAAAAIERDSIFEALSPDKSASYIPLETDEQENRDSEVQDEEDSIVDDMKADEELRAEERVA